MPMDDFDDIQCEDFYGEDPRDDADASDGWLNADGTTGPTGLDFLASLNPEDFV